MRRPARDSSLALPAALLISCGVPLPGEGGPSHWCDVPADCVDPDEPNCGGDLRCFGPCASSADCTHPAYPNCDVATGLCVGPCATAADCPDPALPVCDPETGLCQGPCPETACPAAAPNCDPANSLCAPPCAAHADCPDPALPVCDPTTGVCQGACPGVACPAAFPNCNPATNLCDEPCAAHADCPDPALPVCDPTTGVCQGACPGVACPAALPNCDPATNLCDPPCAAHADCPDATLPVCNPTTGVCQGACPAVACPAALPNCDPSDNLCDGPCADSADCPDPSSPNCNPTNGVCLGLCTDNGDCPDSALPNCGSAGLCFGPCAAHADCTNAAFPNCDPTLGACLAACADAGDCPAAALPNCGSDGTCFGPCAAHADCTNAAFPNCAPTTGACIVACADNGGCPDAALPNCATDGTCFGPCADHADCLPSGTGQRCDLVDAGNLNRCEARDCLTNADCSGVTPVCDTDGLGDPNGGGYCAAACLTPYDCRAFGLDCNTAATPAVCVAHDYGDVGADCSVGGNADCDSGLCLTAEGNVCTAFCCVQHDCPDGWGCRTHADGAGGSGTVDVCVPLSPQGPLSYDDTCATDADCRSGICSGNRCRETCCTDLDCDPTVATGMFCGPGTTTYPRSHCRPKWTGDDLVGTLGCMTDAANTSCSSSLCFTLYQLDKDCPLNYTCTADRPNCWNMGPTYGDPALNECVADFCAGHCCNESDCPDNAGSKYFCGKWLYGTNDYNLCLLYDAPGAAVEGAACNLNTDCRSRFCNETLHLCRARCCTSADCTSPTYPRCGLEQDTVLGTPRLVNVCLP